MEDLPTGLGHAGNLSLVSQFPETNPADSELANVSARSAAQVTTIILAHLELGCPLAFLNERLLGHL